MDENEIKDVVTYRPSPEGKKALKELIKILRETVPSLNQTQAIDTAIIKYAELLKQKQRD